MRTMQCSRTYEWDGIDGGKTYVDKDNEMIKDNVDDLDDDKEHMQKFKPKTPPMLYTAMFNLK